MIVFALKKSKITFQSKKQKIFPTIYKQTSKQMNNEIDSITERAKKYAKETTSTRCALMGKDGCGDCLRSERGDCDYRARVDAYLQGCDDTLRIILTYGETFNSKFI